MGYNYSFMVNLKRCLMLIQGWVIITPENQPRLLYSSQNTLVITVTLHERHGDSNHRQLDYLIHDLFCLTTKNQSSGEQEILPTKGHKCGVAFPCHVDSMQYHERQNRLVYYGICINIASIGIMFTVSAASIINCLLRSLYGFANYAKSLGYAVSIYGTLKRGDN